VVKYSQKTLTGKSYRCKGKKKKKIEKKTLCGTRHSESDGSRVDCVCYVMHVRVGARRGMAAVVVAMGLVR